MRSHIWTWAPPSADRSILSSPPVDSATRRAMSSPSPVDPRPLSPRCSAEPALQRRVRVGDARPGVGEEDGHDGVARVQRDRELRSLPGGQEDVAEQGVGRRDQVRPGHRDSDRLAGLLLDSGVSMIWVPGVVYVRFRNPDHGKQARTKIKSTC